MDDRNVNYNNIRVADVWMDEFKFLFYDRLGKYEKPLVERLGDYGNTEERRALRKDLGGCK